jgi:uncharacterized protein YjbI with pentapeptide repeats
MKKSYGLVEQNCPDCGEKIPPNTLQCPNSECNHKRDFDQGHYNLLVKCAYLPEEIDEEFLRRSGYARQDIAGRSIQDWNARKFKKIKLEGADLRKASLGNGHFEGAIFIGADLRGAKARNAHFDYIKCSAKQKAATFERPTCVMRI